MIEIKIIDNGGETFDRYTVIIEKSVYTMSMHPQQPNGSNQYAGNIEDLDSVEGENKITLNEDVLKAILDRL